jgi:hypothetical protein
MLTKSVLALMVVGLTALVWADDADDGPGRGVARISVINGDVSVRRGDSGDLVAAAINAPLVVEDRVFTGQGSRAELQFDWANMLRISSDAEVRLAELEHRRYMVQVARGTVTWRVLRDQEAYVEVSTPSVSVRPVKRGTYRVTVLGDGTSEITVRAGEAEVFTPRGSERLRAGRTMLARGTQADPEFQTVAELGQDEWDRWNEYRDRDLERSQSYRYVSRDVYGAEDLDGHGRWVYVAPYGYVWSPTVAVGWAPYRYGRWSWIDFYGWSWVSYDPWGWAPYHYGRWFHHGPYGWCWWPGGFRARHYWSPGFVAFFGFGNVGVGFGWGNVGWVPLAPWEPYHRWWGRGWYGGYRDRHYHGNRVTVVNNVNIRNVYSNSRVANGVTIVDQDGFRRGRVSNSIRANEVDFNRATVARGPLPVTPDRTSLRLTEREAGVRRVDSRGSERFFSNRQPAPVKRVSFEDQRRGIEQIARGSIGAEPGRGVRTAESPRTEQRVGERGFRAADSSAGRAAEGATEQRGWRRVTEPATSGNRTGSGESDDGWRRFGAASVDRSGNGRRAEPSTRFGEPAATRSIERSDGGRSASDSDGWTRFGGRNERTAPESAVQSGERSESRGNGRGNSESWSRFGDRTGGTASGESGVVPRSERPVSPNSRFGGERTIDSQPRTEQRSEPRSDRIRISPPIVRERSSGFEGSRNSGPSGVRSSDFGSGRGSSSGMRGGGSAPRNSPSDGGGMRGGGNSSGSRGSGGGGGRSSGGGGRGR